MKKTKAFGKLAVKLENKALSKREQIDKYGYFGLFLFVAIPLPGTGAWTGALIASFLNFKFKDSMIAITGGVISAGIIMSVLSVLVKFLVGLF